MNLINQLIRFPLIFTRFPPLSPVMPILGESSSGLVAVGSSGSCTRQATDIGQWLTDGAQGRGGGGGGGRGSGSSGEKKER